MLESSAARRHRLPLSGIATTLSTSVDCRPISARRTVFTFSQSGTTRPCATSRRMSLLAAGFAMIPTVAMIKTVVAPTNVPGSAQRTPTIHDPADGHRSNLPRIGDAPAWQNPECQNGPVVDWQRQKGGAPRQDGTMHGDYNRPTWRFFDGAVSISISMLLAVLLAECNGCAGQCPLGYLNGLTARDDGIIIVATLLPVSHVDRAIRKNDCVFRCQRNRKSVGRKKRNETPRARPTGWSPGGTRAHPARIGPAWSALHSRATQSPGRGNSPE